MERLTPIFGYESPGTKRTRVAIESRSEFRDWEEPMLETLAGTCLGEMYHGAYPGKKAGMTSYVFSIRNHMVEAFQKKLDDWASVRDRLLQNDPAYLKAALPAEDWARASKHIKADGLSPL